MRCARPIDSWTTSKPGPRCTCTDGNNLLLPAPAGGVGVGVGDNYVKTKNSGTGSAAVDLYVKVKRDATGLSNSNWFSLLPHANGIGSRQGGHGHGKVCILRITETEIDQRDRPTQVRTPTVYIGCLQLVGKSAGLDIKAAQATAFHLKYRQPQFNLKHAPPTHATPNSKKSPAVMGVDKVVLAMSTIMTAPKPAPPTPAKPMPTGFKPPSPAPETELLKNIMRAIETAKHAQDAHILSAAFQAPVPINAFPNYLAIVSLPISLGCIRRRISGNSCRPADRQYLLDDLLDDMQLMANNCQLFNGPCQLTNDAFELLQIAIARAGAFKKQKISMEIAAQQDAARTERKGKAAETAAVAKKLLTGKKVPPPTIKPKPAKPKNAKPVKMVYRVMWTEQDVQLLLELVDQHGQGDFDVVHARFIEDCDEGHQRSKGALSIKYRDIVRKRSSAPPTTPTVTGPAMRPPAIKTKKKVAGVSASTGTGSFTMTTFHRHEQSVFDSQDTKFQVQGELTVGSCTSRPSSRTPSISGGDRSTSMTTDEARAAGKAAATSRTENVFDFVEPGFQFEEVSSIGIVPSQTTTNPRNADEGEGDELRPGGHQWCKQLISSTWQRHPSLFLSRSLFLALAFSTAVTGRLQHRLTRSCIRAAVLASSYA